MYFTAGADVAAGQAVCFYYGYLLPDRALLEYGYLPQQQQQVVPELSGIDRHDADFHSQPLPKLVAEPQPFAGAWAVGLPGPAANGISALMLSPHWAQTMLEVCWVQDYCDTLLQSCNDRGQQQAS
jgi:hypothetical protein